MREREREREGGRGRAGEGEDEEGQGGEGKIEVERGGVGRAEDGWETVEDARVRESKSAAHTMIALVIGSLCDVVLSGSVLVFLHIVLTLVLCFTVYLVGNLLDLLVCTPVPDTHLTLPTK